MILHSIRVMTGNFIAEADNTVPHSIAGFDENITAVGKIFISEIRELVEACHQGTDSEVAVQTGFEFVLSEERGEASGRDSDKRSMKLVKLLHRIRKTEENAGIVEVECDSVDIAVVRAVREEFGSDGFKGGIDFPFKGEGKAAHFDNGVFTPEEVQVQILCHEADSS